MISKTPFQSPGTFHETTTTACHSRKLIDIAETLFAEKGFTAPASGIWLRVSALPSPPCCIISQKKNCTPGVGKLAAEMTADKAIRAAFEDEQEQIFRFVQLLCDHSEKKPLRQHSDAEGWTIPNGAETAKNGFSRRISKNWPPQSDPAS
ncbi:MAG: hypothetical protein R2875_08240 [Desulfobacterales bacterium]